MFFPKEKKRKLNRVHSALESNGYPLNFIKNQSNKARPLTVLSPEELVGTFFKKVETSESHKSFASLPYIKGITETLTRVFKKHITVVNKPLITLNNSSRPQNFNHRWNHRQTPCADCSWSYISETGRTFNTRKNDTSEM